MRDVRKIVQICIKFRTIRILSDFKAYIPDWRLDMAKTKNKALEEYVIEHILIPDYFNRFLLHTKPGLSKMLDVNGSASCCPFHDDINPSFRYWRQKKFFNCFGCNLSGDVINLHRITLQRRLKTRVSREQALKDLCQLYNIQFTTETRTRQITNSQVQVDTIQTSTGTLEIENQSVFDKCRQSINLEPALVESRKHFNLLTFKRENKAIQENANLTLEQRFAAYDKLDYKAQIAISIDEEHLSETEKMTIANIDSAI